MAKLSGEMIYQAYEAGDIKITPWHQKNLGPNSYDLRLGSMLKTYQSDVLDVKKENQTTDICIKPDEGFLLQPGRLYLGHTMEVAGSTKYVPCIEGRSSIARLGIQVHLTAGFGDVGFVGQWTLEISVVEPVLIYSGIRICQIYFDTLHKFSGEKEWLYNGKYNGSVGVVASRSHLDGK